jgi:hypothetical protein
MKVFEVTEGEMIRGKTASRDVGYDPNYKGLQNYDGKHLMNDADAIEALLYGRGFSQEEDAFRDLLIRKYKITRETDIGALLKSIRDQLEAKNRQHIKDRDAENAQIGETATSGGTSAGAVASTPNGFASGGIGTISRAGTPTPNKKQKKTKKKN